jgi:nicotinate-nucleotide adenylyltransferase
MKTGLFFGSFNPIHIGHMAIANYMLSFEGLNEIWFIVSPQNPFKQKQTLLPERQRLEMVHLAINNAPGYRASDIEFSLPQPSYTIHTLAYLKEKFPNREFILIMGQDNLSSFHKWKNYEMILANYSILVYPRQDAQTSEFEKHPSVKLTEAPQFDISSTFIRNAFAKNYDIRFYLPDKVFQYIDEMNFYR